MRRFTRTQQPSSNVGLLGSPIAAWLATTGLSDLAGRTEITNANAASTIVSNGRRGRGIGFASNATTGLLLVGNSATGQGATTSPVWTAVAWMDPFDIGNGQGLVRVDAVPTTSQSAGILQSSSTSHRYALFGGSYVTYARPFNAVAFRRDGAAVHTTLWSDLGLLAEGSSSFAYDGARLRVCPASGGCGVQRLYAAAIFDYFMPRATLHALLDDPWRSLFQPRRIFVPMTAPAGATFNPAWARQRSGILGAGLR